MSEVRETARIEAFSDGVFAIAITLLALEIKVPHLDHSRVTCVDLANALFQQWTNYLAFFISFLVLLIMWTHHHAVVNLMRRADGHFRFANGFLLMIATLTPLPTAMLSDYMQTGAATLAAVFYSGFFVMVSLAFIWFAHAALAPHNLASHASPETVHKFKRSYAMGFWPYLSAFVFAFFAPWVSVGIAVALSIYWAIMTFK